MRHLIQAVGLYRTVILVSHHLGSMRSMDMIYARDQGGVVESGTHEELMAAASTYHELFSIQADAYAHPVCLDAFGSAGGLYSNRLLGETQPLAYPIVHHR